jgi:hypothetical protein
MKERFPAAEAERIRERYAADWLYRTVCRLGPRLQMQTDSFGLKPEECYRDVRALLGNIADEGPDIVPRLDDLWCELYNGYREWNTNAKKQDLCLAVEIVFGYAALALHTSRIQFYDETAARLLIETNIRQHGVMEEKVNKTVLQSIFPEAETDMEDGWFDRFLNEDPDDDAGPTAIAEDDTPAIPQDCLDAVGKVLTDTFTVQPSGTVLNSRKQLVQAAGVVDMSKNEDIARLMAIGKELGAVRSSTTCSDFVRALIGLRVIVYTDKNAIRKISKGISKTVNGYTSRGTYYAPLQANHKQWSTKDQKIGDCIYEAMRTGRI